MQTPMIIAVVSDGEPARLNPFTTANRYAKAKKAAPEMATIPAAKPSSPSIKLTALIVMRTITTVKSWPILGGKVITPLIGNQKICTP